MCIDIQIGELPEQLPLFGHGADWQERVDRELARIWNEIGEIIKWNRRDDFAAVLVFAEQEIEKRGFSPAVSADKAQLPICIDCEADVFKNRVVTGRIGKRCLFGGKRGTAVIGEGNSISPDAAAICRKL